MLWATVLSNKLWRLPPCDMAFSSSRQGPWKGSGHMDMRSRMWFIKKKQLHKLSLPLSMMTAMCSRSNNGLSSSRAPCTATMCAPWRT